MQLCTWKTDSFLHVCTEQVFVYFSKLSLGQYKMRPKTAQCIRLMKTSSMHSKYYSKRRHLHHN